MFGYITINREELKMKDFDRYRGYYCGICRELKEHYGERARMTLTYDMTFLAVLLSGLYEGGETLLCSAPFRETALYPQSLYQIRGGYECAAGVSQSDG